MPSSEPPPDSPPLDSPPSDSPPLDHAAALASARELSQTGTPEDLMAAAELAMQAHLGGEADAGPVFAECADRLAVLSGRPQPFGSIAMQNYGDVSLAPVDQGVTDEQRAEFGIPPLAELRRRLEDESRRLARVRAEQGGLEPNNPFMRVWRDPDPAQLRARWADEGEPCWADGDELTIIAEMDHAFMATPVLPMPSWDAGDGLQVVTVRIDRLPESVITYTRTPLGQAPAMGTRRGSHDGRFRGPLAPPEAPSNDPVIGSLFEHAVESAALGEPRRVTVYKPANRHGVDLPVIFSTDGDMFSAYARRLDAAIESGSCPPVVVVAAHSANAMSPLNAQQNLRALEYLPGFDDRRFDAHQRFFVSELADWADAELPISAERERRAVFGCSDGGGHALATGMLHPSRYGHVFAYSTGMPPDGRTRWNPDAPFVHLCAGTLEGPFHQATVMWAFFLERLGARHHLTERVCGHDLIQWAEELPLAVARAFG